MIYSTKKLFKWAEYGPWGLQRWQKGWRSKGLGQKSSCALGKKGWADGVCHWGCSECHEWVLFGNMAKSSNGRADATLHSDVLGSWCGTKTQEVCLLMQSGFGMTGHGHQYFNGWHVGSSSGGNGNVSLCLLMSVQPRQRCHIGTDGKMSGWY